MNDDDRSTARFHGEHLPGCPARYGDGDCDEEPTGVSKRLHEIDAERRRQDLDTRRDQVLAGALDKRAAERRQLIEQQDARRVAIERLGIDHDAGDDAPAGAGDDVEAFRG